MAQDWTDDSYALGNVAQTDLAHMEENFMALKSLFSGVAAPDSEAACQPWFDTAKHVLKVKDDGDVDWIGLMHGDADHKIWVYRNAAMSGWAIVSGLTDKVLAIKGGANDYDINGGNTAGEWDWSHNHIWHNWSNNNADDLTYDSGGNLVSLGRSTKSMASNWRCIKSSYSLADSVSIVLGDSYTSNSKMTSKRPAAAVGTVQVLDL